MQTYVCGANLQHSDAYLLPSLCSDKLHCLAFTIHQDQALYRALDDECIPNRRTHIIWKAQDLRSHDVI